jgi:hypothetical protein
MVPYRHFTFGKMALRLVAVIIVAGQASAAVAQSASCERWRNELASLPRGGGGDPAAANQAARVGGELTRSINQFRGIGCENSQFSFFGSGPPPECVGMRGRIGQLQAQYASLQSRAQGGGVSERRAQLQAAIESNCRQGVYQTPEPTRQRGFFEALFGVQEEPREARPAPGMPELDPTPVNPEDKKDKGIRYGAGMPVCVRTCDGFFFPLANSPGGRENQEEMCQALCPSAETRVFYMNGSGDIADASSRRGEGYIGLVNANKFTRTFDPACGCRKQGESWTQALQEAEDMLDRRKGDTIISEKRAEELSRPRALTPRPSERERKRLEQQQAQTSTLAASEVPPLAVNNPTAGVESSGIGSRAIEWGQTVGTGSGKRIEVTRADGEKKTVRVVVPTLGLPATN